MASQSRLYAAVAAYRIEVFLRERRALERMERAYTETYAELTREILAAIIDAEEGRLETLPRRLQRYADLIEQITRKINEYAGVALEQTASAQSDLVNKAGDEAQAIAQAYLGPEVLTSWAFAPDTALQNLVGTFWDGSPLRERLLEFGKKAADAAESVLTDTLIRGRGLREAGRELAKALADGRPDSELTKDLLGGVTEVRTAAERIVRTEIHRANRDASRENYIANSDIILGYERIATLDTRTCPVCLALDGTVSELGEIMPSHPNCRCAVAPWFGQQIERVTGPVWFARLDADQQLEILGPGKFELYQAGEMFLADLVAKVDSPDWGPGVREKSLATLRG